MLRWEDKIENFTVVGGRRGLIARIQAALDDTSKIKITLDDYTGKDAAGEEQRRRQAMIDGLKGDVERAQRVIEARDKRPEFKITILHIGTMDEPELCDTLRAKQSVSRAEARKRVRLAMLERGETPTDDAITRALGMDPARIKEVARETREWIEAGTPAGTYERLFKLGGPALLADAAIDIQEAQTLPEDLGEG